MQRAGGRLLGSAGRSAREPRPLRAITCIASAMGSRGYVVLPHPSRVGTAAAPRYVGAMQRLRHIVVVGTTAGRLHEIFWKWDTVGVEGDDDFPVTFNSGSIVAVSGFYDTDKQRHVVVVGTTDGKVHQIYWKSFTVGIEAHSTVEQFAASSIKSVAGFYSSTDHFEHIAVGLSNGAVHELYVRPDV
jgi:hypothetical protein